MVMKKLAFFFPANSPGGVQSIIVRLIKFAFDNKLPFIVIDYKNGYVSSQIKKLSLDAYNKHVIIVKSLSECNFMSEYTFVAFNWQLKFAYFFQKKFKSNFIYWDVHSTSLKQLLDISIFGVRIFSLSTRNLISSLVRESRVLTIDLVSKELLQRMSFSDDIVVTGIPITTPYSGFNLTLPEKEGVLNIAYIGRAVDWKVIPFFYGLSKVIEKEFSYKVKCNVYTDSKVDFISLLPDGYVELDCELNFYEGFSMDEIIKKENGVVNLSMGMGTSQFELMIFGVPTLLIPAVVDEKLLSEFEPIWTHLLPPYVYGFDESTAYLFNSIELPENISLGDAGFSWRKRQLELVEEAACKALALYSSENICNILMSRVDNVGDLKSQAWNNVPFKIFIFWTTVVDIVKKVFVRKFN